MAVDVRNSKEADINGALQSRASNNVQSNNVVRQQYAVRRLTPLEAERLQGLPVVKKCVVLDFESERILLLQWLENQNIDVQYVVEKCRKRQKLVGNAEKDRLQKSVWFAARSLFQNFLKTNKPVQKNVPINCEENTQEKHSLKEQQENVCNVEKNSAIRHQEEITDSALLNVLTNTEKVSEVRCGEMEQRQIENLIANADFGNVSLSEFGKEIMLLAKDVESIMTELEKSFQYTIFDLTETAKKQDLTKRILSYCVQNVTTLSILMPEQIAVLSLEDEPFTLIDDKSCSDSARYKAIGNGMAQPVADWIIKRIVEEVNGYADKENEERKKAKQTEQG